MRVASENQREASIKDQYRVCEEFVTRQHDWNIVARFKNEAISGSQDVTGRAGHRAVTDAAEGKRVDVLVIQDLSRLSRDSVETEKARAGWCIGACGWCLSRMGWTRYLTAELSRDYA